MMEKISESTPDTGTVDSKNIELPQISSLSIHETLPTDTQHEVKKPKVMLVNDIWYMVFHELVKDNHKLPSHLTGGFYHLGRKELCNWLRACRMVSQDFDSIVKPLGYSFVDLSGPLIKDRLPNVSGPLQDSFLNILQDLTTVLQLPSIRDFGFEAHASNLIEGCRKLKIVEFKNVLELGSNLGYKLSYMASLWLVSFLNKRKKPLECRMTATTNFTTIAHVPGPWDEDGRYNYVLKSSIRLHIGFRGRPGFNHLTPIGSPLPAMQRLFLNNYHWNHPREEFQRIWNFSELLELSLEQMNLIEFFTQVPMDSLSNLMILSIGKSIIEASGSELLEEIQDMTRSVMKGVFSCLADLEHLTIRCDDLLTMFPFDVFAGALANIKSLELTGEWVEQLITLVTLNKILLCAANLVCLVLNFNALHTNALEILRLLAETSKLERVCFRMFAYMLGFHDSAYSGTDPDYDAAEKLLKYIHSHRFGASLRVELVVRRSSPPPAWISVDGKDWNPCRHFQSDIDEHGVFKMRGSQRIGSKTTGQVVDDADGSDDKNEAT